MGRGADPREEYEMPPYPASMLAAIPTATEKVRGARWRGLAQNSRARAFFYEQLTFIFTKTVVNFESTSRYLLAVVWHRLAVLINLN